MASNISEIIRKIAFLQGGGKPEGERGIDKINEIFGTIGKGAQGVQGIQNQIIKRAIDKKKLDIATAEEGRKVESARIAAQPVAERLTPQAITGPASTPEAEGQRTDAFDRRKDLQSRFGNLPLAEAVQAKKLLEPNLKSVPQAFTLVPVDEDLAKLTGFQAGSKKPFFQIDDALQRNRRTLGVARDLETPVLRALLKHFDTKDRIQGGLGGEDKDFLNQIIDSLAAKVAGVDRVNPGGDSSNRFQSLEEAQQANLPVGTRIEIFDPTTNKFRPAQITQ